MFAQRSTWQFKMDEMYSDFLCVWCRTRTHLLPSWGKFLRYRSQMVPSLTMLFWERNDWIHPCTSAFQWAGIQPLPPTPTTPNNLLNVFLILLHMVEDKQKLMQIFWGKFLRYTGQMDMTVVLSERWLSPFAFRCFPPANFPKSNNVISNKTLSSYPNSPLLSQKKKKKRKEKKRKILVMQGVCFV